MRLQVLASGSRGNSLMVESSGTRILVDLGLSCRALETRARQCGIDAGAVDAVLFTHDHSDHYCALRTFAKKFPLVRLFANLATADAIARATGVIEGWTTFETACPFQIGELTVESFSVPHDAADAVGYLISDGASNLFVATDFGIATLPVKAAFARAEVAVLESNHDARLLAMSDRPEVLKQRIASRSGHLSNDDAAELFKEVNPPKMRTLLLAHLSSECNSPHLALEAMQDVCHSLGRTDVDIATLSQDVPSKLYEF